LSYKKNIIQSFLAAAIFFLTTNVAFTQINDLDQYIFERFIDKTGREIAGISVPGKPPSDTIMPIANPAKGSVILNDVPGYDWSFGCSPTSAAMMAAYYDRTGYHDIYTGPANYGVAPMDNSSWGGVWINGEYRKQCPISATRNGVDGVDTNAHVDDYWYSYGSSGPDPFVTNGWTEHTHGECTADYMGTNQWAYSNTDGSTSFWYYTNGAPLYNYSAPSGRKDGCYGIRGYFESRGYTVNANYTQLIYGYNGNTQGFTFDQFKQEIDAGRPVMVHVTGHSMLGYGYDDSNQLIYIRNTWDYNMHSMTWGGAYSGMDHYSVTVINLQDVPFIIVETPNGGESWDAGSAYDINWRDNISENVQIDLYKSGAQLLTITPSTPSDGLFSWDIPQSLTDDDDYNIMISSISAPAVYDTSNTVFSINQITPVNRDIQNVNVNNGESNCYDATNIITVAGPGTTVNIYSGADVDFIAGSKVSFKTGFHAYYGSYSHAYIAPAGPFCTTPPTIVANQSNNTDRSMKSFSMPDVRKNISDDIILYPNPVSEIAYIQFLKENTFSTIILIDLRGNIITETEVQNHNKMKINMEGLSDGVYFVMIISGNEIISKKIVKIN
jgi:hypothetical protein